LRTRVLAAVAGQETDVSRPVLGRRAFERPTWRAFAAAIAATIVVTLGLQTLISTCSPPNEAVLAVVAGHMRAQISGQPVDVASSDRHTVKPWLAAKLPVATIVANLGPEGFELLGGRIDIVRGAPTPTVVYKRRQHLVSLTELHPAIGDYPANSPGLSKTKAKLSPVSSATLLHGGFARRVLTSRRLRSCYSSEYRTPELIHAVDGLDGNCNFSRTTGIVA